MALSATAKVANKQLSGWVRGYLIMRNRHIDGWCGGGKRHQRCAISSSIYNAFELFKRFSLPGSDGKENTVGRLSNKTFSMHMPFRRSTKKKKHIRMLSMQMDSTQFGRCIHNICSICAIVTRIDYIYFTCVYNRVNFFCQCSVQGHGIRVQIIICRLQRTERKYCLALEFPCSSVCMYAISICVWIFHSISDTLCDKSNVPSSHILKLIAVLFTYRRYIEHDGSIVMQ